MRRSKTKNLVKLAIYELKDFSSMIVQSNPIVVEPKLFERWKEMGGDLLTLKIKGFFLPHFAIFLIPGFNFEANSSFCQLLNP